MIGAASRFSGERGAVAPKIHTINN